MKKGIMLFLLIFFGLIILLSAGNIGLIEPHQNAVWCKGQTYEIVWMVLGDVYPVSKLRLYNASNTVKILNIINKVPTPQGVFPWKVPFSIPDGKYVIRIKTINNKTYAVSKVFTIKNCSAPAPSPSLSGNIKIISPAPNVEWIKGNTYKIRWQYNIKKGIPIKIRLLDSITMTKVLGIVDSYPGNTGSFDWKIPDNIKEGIYRIRVKTIDNKIWDDSQVFKIKNGVVIAEYKPIKLEKPYIFYSPKSTDTWRPLHSYEVHLEFYRNKVASLGWGIMSVYSKLRFKIVSVDNPKVKPLIIAEQNYNSPYKQVQNIAPPGEREKMKHIYHFVWYFKGSYNLPTGKYKVVFQSLEKPSLTMESDVFHIVNNLPSGGGYLDIPGVGDVKINGMYFDNATKNVYVSITNNNYPLSDFYLNYVLCTTEGGTKSQSFKCENRSKSGFVKNIKVPQYQTVKVPVIKNFQCFNNKPPASCVNPSPFPRPIWFSASLMSNKTNEEAASISGFLCKTLKPDIRVRDVLFLEKKNGGSFWLKYNTYNEVPKYLFKNTSAYIEAPIQVDIENWGCTKRTFYIDLYVEDGPYLNEKKGIRLGSMTLGPGETGYFKSSPVKISIPMDGKFHKLVLIADQEEAGNEGYMQSYLNNIIVTFVKIVPENNRLW